MAGQQRKFFFLEPLKCLFHHSVNTSYILDVNIGKKTNKINLGETKLICWFTGLTNPILCKSKKIILQNFVQLAFF